MFWPRECRVTKSRTQFSLCHICMSWASLVAQMVKHLPAMQETRVGSLGWEDSLEKEMAIHSSILAWRIPWTEEPGRLQSMGLQKLDTTYQLNHHHQDPLSMGFPKQEYWRGWPFPSPGDLPNISCIGRQILYH